MKKCVFIVAVATFVLSMVSCGNQENKKFQEGLGKLSILYHADQLEEGYELLQTKVADLAKTKEEKYVVNQWYITLRGSTLSKKVRQNTVDRSCLRFVHDYVEINTLKECLELTQDWVWAYELYKRKNTDIKEIEDIVPYLITPQDFKEFSQTFSCYLTDAPCWKAYQELLLEKLKDPYFFSEFNSLW
ncbi:MAG: hypothetical protein LBI53_03185 [Candidatus Peribacteria bacterium]|jgi:hypothetical protein|nr:hypothetical protein [Candidatus Peribacteria bacterium]